VIGALPTISWLANTPPPPTLEPRNRGAMIAANLSAAITPLIRTVRSTSPRAMLADRTAALSGFPLSPDVAWRLKYEPTAATATTVRSTGTQIDLLWRGALTVKVLLME
jgi:hypothetical protein